MNGPRRKYVASMAARSLLKSPCAENFEYRHQKESKGGHQRNGQIIDVPESPLRGGRSCFVSGTPNPAGESALLSS
jgi:hypothetical protein